MMDWCLDFLYLFSYLYLLSHQSCLTLCCKSLMVDFRKVLSMLSCCFACLICKANRLISFVCGCLTCSSSVLACRSLMCWLIMQLEFVSHPGLTFTLKQTYLLWFFKVHPSYCQCGEYLFVWISSRSFIFNGRRNESVSLFMFIGFFFMFLPTKLVLFLPEGHRWLLIHTLLWKRVVNTCYFQFISLRIFAFPSPMSSSLVFLLNR